jgi:hypothetical protein
MPLVGSTGFLQPRKICDENPFKASRKGDDLRHEKSSSEDDRVPKKQTLRPVFGRVRRLSRKTLDLVAILQDPNVSDSPVRHFPITKSSWKLTRAPTCPKEESIQSDRESSLSPIRIASLCISCISSVVLVRVRRKKHKIR